MILVDTSVWVDHLRRTEPQLQAMLASHMVLSHPFIIGELALGNMKNRDVALRNLARLPNAVVAMESEVLAMIEAFGLAGSGIGYVGVHLLAAARLTAGASLWSRDKRLAGAAASLDIAFDPET